MISHKAGVRIALCHWTIGHIIHIADQVYEAHGEEELVVTSGTEGTHSPGSRHYLGFAVDIRKPSDPSKAVAIKQELATRLGPDFDVVLEDSHLHVEVDPKQPYR